MMTNVIKNFTEINLVENKIANHFYFETERCLYKTRSSKSGVRYLCCIEEGCHCKAKIIQNVFERTNNTHHIHTDHAIKAEFEISFSQLRNVVKTDRRPVRMLHREALRLLSAEAAGMMAWNNVRQTLQRIRRHQMPPCTTMHDLIELLEENENVYQSYGMLRDKPFYNGSIHGQLIFANLELIAALDPVFNMFVDGTFGVVPFSARQLLVVLGEVNGRPRPLLYAVMTGQTEADYAAVLTHARDAIFSFDGTRRIPISVTCDFELSMRNALKQVWQGINTVGCNFHLCQSLRRKASSFPSLSTRITGPSPHHTILILFMRLSLLPIQRIDDGLNALLNHINALPELANDFGEFIVYFQRTWVRRFPKEEWCVSGRERRTNNHLEGYNNFIKQSIPMKPSPFAFLEGLLNLAYDANASFHSDAQRHPQPLPDRSTLSAPLRVALDDLEAGRIDELNFLLRMANTD